MRTVTSEYVGYGHPDKIADIISDNILDAHLKGDPNTRSAVECMVKDNIVVLGGEITSTHKVNYTEVVKDVFRDITFSDEHRLHPDNIKVLNLIGLQSPEISSIVHHGDGNLGAGDQGFVVGYASNETPNKMPLGHYIAKSMTSFVCGLGESFGTDCKSQVVIDYVGSKPVIREILVSTLYYDDALPDMRSRMESYIRSNHMGVSMSIFEQYFKDKDFTIKINPKGSWKIGGSVSDCGMTGRKIVVDQYGGYCNVGGGAFSGKDGTKIDRSAAYAARHLAINILEFFNLPDCKVTLGYVIGETQPCSINVESSSVMIGSPKRIVDYIKGNVDLSPSAIIDRYRLKSPVFRDTAKWGHFGREGLLWEQLDMQDDMLRGIR